mmetsp:Transcript_158373/g.507974  ORF Transcript_158373/g.507974 Transcript_158373/m.507974 type:complete len:365 (-) Transcript_158373:474-1568(-)
MVFSCRRRKRILPVSLCFRSLASPVPRSFHSPSRNRSNFDRCEYNSCSCSSPVSTTSFTSNVTEAVQPGMAVTSSSTINSSSSPAFAPSGAAAELETAAAAPPPKRPGVPVEVEVPKRPEALVPPPKSPPPPLPPLWLPKMLLAPLAKSPPPPPKRPPPVESAAAGAGAPKSEEPEEAATTGAGVPKSEEPEEAAPPPNNPPVAKPPKSPPLLTAPLAPPKRPPRPEKALLLESSGTLSLSFAPAKGFGAGAGAGPLLLGLGAAAAALAAVGAGAAAFGVAAAAVPASPPADAAQLANSGTFMLSSLALSKASLNFCASSVVPNFSAKRSCEACSSAQSCASHTQHFSLPAFGCKSQYGGTATT